MSERLQGIVEIWLERVLADDKPDPAAFAAEHGVPLAELQPLLDNARWLVGRHREQRPGDRLPAPPFELGDFQVLEEAGRGGMGVVFRAVQRSLGRPVAIKILDGARHGADSRARVRFLREAQAAARLAHQHIVRVLVVGETDGHAWFAMEWVEGESLAQVIAHRRATSHVVAARRPATDETPDHAPREVARLVAKVGRALHHAHEHGLLHRDVKPGNILVDREGEPHLADFGLVRDLLEPGLTATGEVLGSPPYMSPEQVRGERALTPRTDVYSLGVTLYECLTLNRPFRAEDTLALRAQILGAPVPPPRACDPRVPADLQWICLKAMARESDVRYPSAAAMAADLEAFLRGEPVHAGPPSSTLRLRRALRRHQRVLAGAGGLLVTVALAAWGWSARAELLRAELAATHDRVALARVTEDRGPLLRVLGSAIAQHPGEPVFLLQRAIHLLAVNHAADAAKDVAHAHALRPDDTELGEVVRALAAATAIAAGEAPTDEQRATVDRIARVDGDRGEFVHLRGVLLSFLGRYDEAEPLLQRARNLDRSLGVETDLVVANLGLGRPREALAELDRFTASRPVPSVLFVRCRLLATHGDWQAAQADLDRLERLAPKSAFTAGARIVMAVAPAHGGLDIAAEFALAQRAPDWREAAGAVERAVAEAHHLRREPDRALPAFAIVVEQDPRNAKLRSLLGICCYELADKQEGAERDATLQRGRAELELAAELSRHLPFECDMHAGLLAFFTQRWSDAVALLRRAVAKAPEDPKRLRSLAYALVKLGGATADPAERLRLLEECAAAHRREVELAPRDGRAVFLLRTVLTALAKELKRRGDPRAADIERELAALVDGARR